MRAETAVSRRQNVEGAFRLQERRLRTLAYRLTGVAADAEEIVQETFVRALERPPSGELAPWLVRVVTNLSLDVLRGRRRRRYPGPWLPSPVETEDPALASTVDAGELPAARYERLEGVSYAFLVALEELGPRARAVVVLRDAFDYSAREVAEALGTTEANVRIVHHRARRRLRDRAAIDGPLPRELADRTRRTLERFLDCLARQDVAGVEALLAEEVRTLTDGGGDFTALRAPLVGRGRVAAFHLKVARERGPISRVEIRSANGRPAAFVETAPKRPRQAPRVVLRCELDAAGRIAEIHSILAPQKLTAVRFAR